MIKYQHLNLTKPYKKRSEELEKAYFIKTPAYGLAGFIGSLYRGAILVCDLVFGIYSCKQKNTPSWGVPNVNLKLSVGSFQTLNVVF
ncbi:hypothetical protein [Paenibacillus sp. KN14-4R]|uniref:hypothetical protein n=1 Tax=Paenibacillus sp. KN14-4R TaxID=3445773 RepID=UPI003FA02B08